MKAQPRLRKDGQPSRSGAHFRDSNFQKRMRQRVSREACARNGRKGFQATRNRYGLRFVVEQVVSWRRQNPTDIEKTVMGWLDEFQLLYDKDVLIADGDAGGVYADLVLRDTKFIIEVDGACWHRNDALHGEDREGRDRYKDAVFKSKGYRVLRLKEVDIKSGCAKELLDCAVHRHILGFK